MSKRVNWGVCVVCLLLLTLLFGAAVSAQPSTPIPTYTSYTVARGDTLNTIAQRFGTTVAAILAANNLPNPNVILVGTVLRIPINPPAFSTPGPYTLVPYTIVPYTIIPPTPLPPSPTVPPTPTVPALPTATPLPSIGFDVGGVVSGTTHLSTLATAGMTWAEIRLTWKLGAPVGAARNAITQVHASNLKVLLQISGDPKELASDPATYEASFATYLGAVAALSPDAIQVWGDMNVPSAWPTGQIDPSAYAQMLASAYVAIKRADAQVLVISGGLAESNALGGQCSSAGCDDLPYLQGMAAAGVGQAADCIGVDYTLGAVAPDAVIGDSRGSDTLYYYPQVVSTYAQIFPTKPLCFTEIGYLVPSKSSRDPWAANTTPDDQAAWLAGAVVLARQIGRVRLLMIYNVDGSGAQAGYAILDAANNCLACQAIHSALSAP